MKKLLSILIICALALGVIVIGIATWRFYDSTDPYQGPTVPDTLTLSLKGDKEIFLEFGQEYLEPGSVAVFSSTEITAEVPVSVKGTVDISRVGDYTLEYSAQIGDLSSTDSRIIHVIDTQKPVITLISTTGGLTVIGREYEEEGFAATDNYDGDITDKVQREIVGDTVVYTVTDSSGNTFTITRAIQYFDPGKPDIQLVGSKAILLVQGDIYNDPGVIATDANDGDMTASVAVEGMVDATRSGIYTLRYTATNRYGFSSSVERIIYVLPPELVPLKAGVDPDQSAEPVDPNAYPVNCVIPQGGIAYEPTGKVIYLTFDDGPSYYTPILLDVLAKYQIKATFFVVQTSYIDVLARTAREGHSIGIHTSSHVYKNIYASEDAYLADMLAMQQVIQQYTDQTTMLLRFPGGSSNTISSAYNKGIMTRLTKLIPEMGYTYFDWNVDSDDAGGAYTTDKVFKNIVNGINGYRQAVVLQHDTKIHSINAIERLIVWGLVNGYSFQPLTSESPTCHHVVFN